MGDSEVPHVRAAEPMTVNVLRARNLKGQRGDTVNVMVKVEFGEKSLGESVKVECTPETPAEINFNASFNITFEDPLSLDEISYKPVLVTLIEILPKERKQREERTVNLGQVAVDLLPLLHGEKKHVATLPICPLPGSPMENLPAEHAVPEVDVSISVNEPLFTESQLKESNLMSVTLESLYSPPESWSMSGQNVFTAVMPVPLKGEKENPVVFAGGQLKPGIDKEVPNKQKKWAAPGGAQGNAVYISNALISANDNYEDEDGDYRKKEDRDHRITSETDKNRATWNIERRCHLDPTACKSLQEKIAKTRYWPVEVMKAGPPGGGKGKKEDEGHVSFHGVAYINMAPLLYPGVKRIRGAFKVHAYSDSDLHEKTLRKVSLAEEGMKIANNILSRSSTSPFPKKGKEEKKDKEPKKGPSGALKTSDGSEAGQQEVNVEGQQYVEAKSYITLEIELRRPLVPKRPPEELARRVAEYIPPRPLFPKRTDGAQKSVEDFHSQVGSVANLVLDEFREMFGEELMDKKASTSHESMEERRQRLIYHLNSSGKYFAFKEQLKHAVVKIVREKYLKTTAFQDKDELQAFLSELYVYLVDQMHVGINRVLAVEDQSPIPAPLTDSAQLKHFAREAEVNRNFELASKYYQERIAREKNDPDHWVDYGTYCLYVNDLTKAEECFKECVAIDQRHMEGLLLYGVVCTMQDKHEAAETFFEAATNVDPKSILAWTMLGLFYDGIGNEIGAEMALLEANKLNLAGAKALRDEQREQERLERERQKEKEREKERDREVEEEIKETTEDLEPATDPSIGPGDSAVSIRHQPATPTGSTAGDAASKGKPSREKRHSAIGRKSSPGNSGKLRSIDNATGSRPGSNMRLKSPAMVSHEEPAEELPPSPTEPCPVPSTTIFMHVVPWLLEVKAMPFTERALAHQLLDPLGGPSADYHICLARLKLQKSEMNEGEDSLKEALQFDHQNPDAWALMGHVKYLVGDTETAKDCYERTLAFIGDASEMHSIYLRLASIYLQETKFQDAKNTFLMACKRSPSCVSWLGVGIACYRLGELSEAEDALAEANILNNSDPEVWAYLSLVCLKTGRQVEAEQTYKYALKLNLQEEDLLSEIHQVQTEVGFGNPQL